MPVYKGTPTKDGRCWYFRVYKKDFQGDNKQFKSQFYSSKKEAHEEERLFLLRRDNPTHKPFELVAEDYFKYLRTIRKVSTCDTFYRNYKKHILPYFINKNIDEITTNDLTTWKNVLLKQKYSISFLNGVYSAFSLIFDYAVENYGLFENPLKKVKRFQEPTNVIKKKKEIEYITLEQFNKFIECVDEKYKALFYFAYYTGCRKSEIQALKFTDLDFDKKEITINKNLYTKAGHSKDKLVIQAPKNGKERTITMNKVLYDIMKEHYKYMTSFKDYDENWYVFGGSFYVPYTTMDRVKDKAFALSGVPKISMHQFRHSNCSLLISEYIKRCEEKNIPIDMYKFLTLLSKRLGHSIQVMLDTYAHFFPSTQDDIVNLLDNL